MTIEIKKSWFNVNWNKPKRIKRHIKRYMKKMGNLNVIKTNYSTYIGQMPKEANDAIGKKSAFYWNQYMKLNAIRNALDAGKINETNKDYVLEQIFNGKQFYQLKFEKN